MLTCTNHNSTERLLEFLGKQDCIRTKRNNEFKFSNNHHHQRNTEQSLRFNKKGMPILITRMLVTEDFQNIIIIGTSSQMEITILIEEILILNMCSLSINDSEAVPKIQSGGTERAKPPIDERRQCQPLN